MAVKKLTLRRNAFNGIVVTIIGLFILSNVLIVVDNY